ncbi:MAG: chromosomal replication initiator protein DnaA [Flavobacteriales bacterium]|jgi:chromosomal replication initiator protein|nr:chromosomal replication initiator protein DnaA [Flavobacteriales bacterium]
MQKTPENIWQSCLEFIRQNVSTQSFKTWFGPIHPLKLKGNVLHISVPSKFFYEWLEEHYVGILKEAITLQLGPEGKLVYSISSDKKLKSNNLENTPQNKKGKSIINQSKELVMSNPFKAPMQIDFDSQLNVNYRFDSFVEGNSNKLARSAGFAVAQRPGGTSFNPLLFYGGVGLGKTHLAHAIGNETLMSFPDKRVLYVSAEKFTQQYIDSIRKNTKNDFLHFYQMIDVLIIDDVQFFAGKEKTQDIFFHIFNHLHQHGKQLILTSDRAPVEIQGVEQRLLSRFKWGLSAEIDKPSYEMRFEVLQRKLAQENIEMDAEVVDYLASSINTNIRELEGVLISLVAQASLLREEITISLAEQVVRRFVSQRVHEVTIHTIQLIVCEHYNVSMDALQSKTRKRPIVQARQVAMFLAKKYTKNSLVKIGKEIGGRDHATVLHALKTVKNLMDIDKSFNNDIGSLERKLKKD